MLTHHTFQAYPATAKATFDCPGCGKKKRTRSFRVECTVNPFNKNEDGTIKTPFEVRQQSAAKVMQERVEFLRKPLCKACEDAMSWKDRRSLHEERRAPAAA